MASTKIVRKLRRKRSDQARKRNTIKVLTAKPVVKNVDIEELKASFGGAKKATAKKAAPKKEEAPKAEAAAEVKEEAKEEKAPKAEAKEESKEA